MQPLRVGVIGCGYWGPNLIRNLCCCPLTEVAVVYDSNPGRLEAVRRAHGHLKTAASLDEFLEEPLQAVAIATPVATHYSLAERCLDTGLHVLVEKPLAASVSEAEALVNLAARKQRVLMVDHTYLFSSAVRYIRELVEQGELGELYYVDSIRINLGLFQRDINVIWDLAPHDLSIVDQVLGLEARSVSAWGCAHANHDIEDVAYVNVDYGDRLLANFHLNWLSPVKVRQMIFAGSHKSLIFNELNTSEPIKVYHRGIEVGQSAEERYRLLVSYRSGDIWSPHIEQQEALQAVVTHFAECIREGKVPLSDGALGVRVVRYLEAATRSIRAQGGRVVLSNGSSNHGVINGRAHKPERLPTDRSRRRAGRERDRAQLRELVRLSDR